MKNDKCLEEFEKFFLNRKNKIESLRDNFLKEKLENTNSSNTNPPSPTILFSATMEAVDNVEECHDIVVWETAWKAARKSIEDYYDNLLKSAIGLRDDLLLRAEIQDETKVVNVSDSIWKEFKLAINNLEGKTE